MAEHFKRPAQLEITMVVFLSSYAVVIHTIFLFPKTIKYTHNPNEKY